MQLPNVDRFATLYFFNPLLKRFPPHNKLRIPILMYHSISEDKSNSVHSYYKTTTSPRIFSEQMNFLAENNYRVISVNEITELFNSLHSITEQKYAIITFDDGFRDFYTEAFPILQKYGFTSTVYLPTTFISKNRGVFKDKECLNWDEVIYLYKQGVTFGSHTVTHPQLKSLKRDEVEREIKKSKEIIEDKIGKPVDSFSYPYAFPEKDKDFTGYLKNILKKYDYKNAVSTRIGTTTSQNEPFSLKRIPVNSCDDITLFKAKLNGGYDWMYKLQYLSKILKGI